MASQSCNYLPSSAIQCANDSHAYIRAPFSESSPISRNLAVGHGQFWVKRHCYNHPCSSAKPCASTASCMTGQWQEVRMEGWRPLSSIFSLTASAFQRGQSLWFLDRDDLLHVYHLMSHLSPGSCFLQLFANIKRHTAEVYL